MWMKIITVLCIAAAVGYVSYVFLGERDSAVIVLTDRGFEPRDVTVRKGGAVTFTTDVGRPFWPASNLHPDHSIYPLFDPRRPLQPDEEWTFVFDRAGEWQYHDHMRSYYIGTITVIE